MLLRVWFCVFLMSSSSSAAIRTFRKPVVLKGEKVLVLKDCSDRLAKCKSWAQDGECYWNRGFMHIYCSKACGLCNVTDPKCVDHNDHCAAWSDMDECKRNRSFMKKACRRACSFCLPARDKSIPYIRTNVVEEFWDVELP